MNIKYLINGCGLVSISLLLMACASQPSSSLAIQNIQQQYEVAGVGNSQMTAKNNAIQAANQTCGKNAIPILIKEDARYNGSLKDVVDEKTGKMIQAASKVLGQMAGTTLGLSGDEDYINNLTFKCQAK